MTEDFDVETLFHDLSPEQAREVAGAMIKAGQQTVTALRQPQTAEGLDAQEAAELAELQKSVRGPNYALQKRQLQERYAFMRDEANRSALALDPEIEEVKDSQHGLYNLYQKRLKTIRRGDVRKVAELKAQFRPYLKGL
jgi:hypothetical protein